MLYDTHIHTQFSHDSKMRVQDAASMARELGLGIVVTEHIDLNYPDPEAFRFNVDDYFNAYAQYRSKQVLLGVEIGLSSEDLNDNRLIVQNHPFDYVIGSIHIVNFADTYHESYYQGKTKQQAYGEYLDTMLECVLVYDFIDSMGHIDYICRYARYQDQHLYYEEFKEKLDPVLIALARHEKCLEINTRRIGDKDNAGHLLPIYKRFKEVGGKYVTIGSDAHSTRDIGKNLKEALDIADYAGLKPVWFCERQMQYL